MAPRLSGQTSTFSGVFFLFKSRLGTEGQKDLTKFAILSWKPRSHVRILIFIIHQIFSLARDWSKHVTWPNIPQPKLGNIREYSRIFKTARVAKKIWRTINTLASILGENMLGYLSLDIICSSKLTVHFSEQIMSADKYPRIFSRQMEAIVYTCFSFDRMWEF